MQHVNYILYNYKYNFVVYYSETVILNCNYIQDTPELNKMGVC